MDPHAYEPPYVRGSAIPGSADAIVAINSSPLRRIIRRKKNHIFRRFVIPSNIERIWFFDRTSARAITHYAVISEAKRPGEINDPTMLGNVDFDNNLFGRRARAYEILSLSVLRTPITQDELREGGGPLVGRGWTIFSEDWADRAFEGGIVGVY